jgi:hypothetical protein
MLCGIMVLCFCHPHCKVLVIDVEDSGIYVSPNISSSSLIWSLGKLHLVGWFPNHRVYKGMSTPCGGWIMWLSKIYEV